MYLSLGRLKEVATEYETALECFREHAEDHQFLIQTVHQEMCPIGPEQAGRTPLHLITSLHSMNLGSDFTLCAPA